MSSPLTQYKSDSKEDWTNTDPSVMASLRRNFVCLVSLGVLLLCTVLLLFLTFPEEAAEARGKRSNRAANGPGTPVLQPMRRNAHGEYQLPCNIEGLQKQYPAYSGKFRVSFYAGGLFVNEAIISHPTKNVFLDIEDLMPFVNKDFQCVFETLDPLPSTGQRLRVTSPDKFMGVHAENKTLTAKEGETQKLRIVSNVPLVCEHSLKCCLTLNLALGASGYDLATISDCSYELCADDWNTTTGQASMEIPVVANPDGLKEGQEIKVIKFRPLVPVGGGDMFQKFNNMKIPEVPVVIEDKNHITCATYGEPHTKVFEGDILVDVYETGDFILYEDEEKDFSVAMRTWPYQNTSVACAILAREGDDIVRVSICNDYVLPDHLKTPDTTVLDKLDYYQRNTPLRVKTPTGQLPGGSKVYMDEAKTTVSIDFKSGASVDVKKQGFALAAHINLIPPDSEPKQHLEKTAGVCGVLGRCQTDGKMIGRDGKVYPFIPDPRYAKACLNKQYTNTWRLSKHNTPFYNPPKKPSAQPGNSVKYCGCSSLGVPKDALINCTDSLDKLPKAKTCATCNDITTMLPPGLFGGAWASDAGSTSTSIDYKAIIGDDYDPFEIDNFGYVTSPPVNSNPFHNLRHRSLNEQENLALRTCLKSMQSSQMGQLYGDLHVLHFYTQECIRDYLLSNSTLFVKPLVSAFNLDLLSRVARQPEKLTENANGDFQLKPHVTEHVCSEDCEDHGTCNRGVCTCSRGWSGHDCSIRLASRDKILAFTGGTSVCDVAKESCRQVHFVSKNVDFSSTLSCKHELINNNTGSVDKEILRAGRMSPVSVDTECDLPDVSVGKDHGFAYQHLNISISSAGRLFSKTLSYIIYDSRCVQEINGILHPRPDVCIIDKRCYSDGARQNAQVNSWCRSRRSQTSWTGELKLLGPDLQLRMICDIGNLAGIRRRVEWYVNGQKVQTDVLARNQRESTLFLLDVFKTSPMKIQCVLIRHGHYFHEESPLKILH